MRSRKLPPHLQPTEPIDSPALMRLQWAHSAYAVVLMYDPDEKTWRSAVVPRKHLPEITYYYVSKNRDHATAHAIREIIRIADGR